MIRSCRMGWLAILFIAIGCTGGGKEEPVEEPEKTGPGSITGKVLFEGEPPRMPKVQLDDECMDLLGGKEMFHENLVMNENGTLRNVLVFIKAGLQEPSYPAPEEPVSVAMKGCRFEPHVFGVMRGQTIRILNDDPIPRTVRAGTRTNSAFTKKIPKQGQVLPHVFDKVEIPISFQCLEQKWIHAYCGVMDHPFFAVTGSSGAYELKGVPPGEYTVEAWQERLGGHRRVVAVEPETTVTADFVLKEE